MPDLAICSARKMLLREKNPDYRFRLRKSVIFIALFFSF